MENNFGIKAPPDAKEVAHTIRETLLKVCRHYQDPGLGSAYASIAHYYEKQVAAIPHPPERQSSAKCHS